MTRLRIDDGGVVREVVLDGGTVRLGRLEDCDVVLGAEGVSREHAELSCERGVWWITDLASRNGTFVNDEPVERHRLADGDIVRLGPDARITLVEDAAASGDARRAASPRRNEGGRGEAGGPSGPPSVHGAGQVPWWRHVRWRLVPRSGGDEVELARPLTVGREAGNGLVLPDESVSRLHARIERTPSELHVVDLKSANGTTVNGARIVRATLAGGDRLAFGDVAFDVERHEGIAWMRLVPIALGAAAAIAVVVGVIRIGDALHERGEGEAMARRVRSQAVAATEQGIQAARAGDAEMARAHLLHAADLLLLSDLAPAGATLDRPELLFREVVRALPPGEREFDLAQALDPQTVAASQARLASLTNREYVDHQVRRYAVELGQDSNVPQVFIDQVGTFVDAYQRYPGTMRAMLRRAADLQPRIRRLLAARHLPEAFCYVPWVESELDPMRRSPVGAVGLWQLMPATAREFHLTVDEAHLQRDERTNVERSTAAAADYIAMLLRDQGPEYFMLVLASYNRGENALARAKQRVDDPMLAASRKYWYLVEHGLIPEETRDYVPKIFAARVIAEAPERFGFEAS